uniref:SH3 domain-containing protein n=1 Tax=Echinostoma caproni TaxID=27848 RepID=A0A183A6W2_9TREM
LECEDNVYESIGWTEELIENIELLYQENCVGKNQMEADELLMKCLDIYKQAKTTYAYCNQLLETYTKLCEADKRKLPRNILLSKNRLLRLWPRLEARIQEYRQRAEAAEDVYSRVDVLLNRVQEYLLEAARSPVAFDRVCGSPTVSESIPVPNESQREQLVSIKNEFQEAKSLGVALVDKLPKGLITEFSQIKYSFFYNSNETRDPIFVGVVMDEVSRLIRLKLYTLWLKIREFEYLVMGHNNPDQTTASELGMDTLHPLARSRSTNSTYKRHGSSSDVVAELQNAPFYSPYDSGTLRNKRSPRDRHNQDPYHPPIPANYDPTAQCESRNSRARSAPSTPPTKVQASSEQPLSTTPVYEVDHIDFQPAKKQEKLPSASRSAFRNLSSATERRYPTTHDSSFDNIERQPQELNRTTTHSGSNQSSTRFRPQSGTDGEYRDEQDRFMRRNRSSTDSGTRNVEGRSSDSRTKRSGLEKSTKSSPSNSQGLGVRLNDLRADLEECRNRLYDLVNATCLSLSQNAANASQVDEKDPDWRTIVSTQDIKRISMIGEEAVGMNATVPAQQKFITNLLNQVQNDPHPELESTVEDVNMLWATYQRHLDVFFEFIGQLDKGYKLLPRIGEFRAKQLVYLNGNRQPIAVLSNFQKEGEDLDREIADVIETEQLYSSADQIRGQMNVRPKINWLIQLLKRERRMIKDGLDDVDLILANLRTDSSMETVDLAALIPLSPSIVDGTRGSAGRSCIKDQSNGMAHSTSAGSFSRLAAGSRASSQDKTPTPTFPMDGPPPIPPRYSLPRAPSAVSTQPVSAPVAMDRTTLQITPKIVKDVGDMHAQLLNSATGALAPISLTVQYKGFITVPQVKWSFAGKPVDTKIWQIRVELNESSIFSNVAHVFDQGAYECQITDSQTGFEIRSVGALMLAPTNEQKTRSSLMIGENQATGFVREGEPLTLRCPLDPTIPLSDCTIDWLHNGNVIYTFNPSRRLATSPTVLSAPSPSGKDHQFQNGETIWRTYVAEGCCALATNTAHKTDHGVYICRIHSRGQVFESEGVVTIPTDLAFSQPLRQMSVQIGQPVTLFCQVKPGTFSGQTQTKQTKSEAEALRVKWFFNEEHLNPYKCLRMGIQLHSASSGCMSLIIQRAGRAHAGHYRCEVSGEDETITTECDLEVKDINEALNVRWFHNDMEIDPAGTPVYRPLVDQPRPNFYQLEISNINNTLAGSYKVEVTRATQSFDNDIELPVLAEAECWVVIDDHGDLKQEQHVSAPQVIHTGFGPALNVKPGDPFELTCHVSGFPKPSFCWIKDRQAAVISSLNDIEVSGLDSIYQLAVREANSSHSGEWTLVCYNAYGAVAQSSTVTLFDAGVPYHGGVEALGSELVAGVEKSTTDLPPPPSQRELDGNLYTQITDLSQDGSKARQSPSSMMEPPEFKSVFTDAACRIGDTVRLQSLITGCPTPAVHWTVNGKQGEKDDPRRRLVCNGEAYTLVIKHATLGDSGRYALTAENIIGVATCSALLVVCANPVSRPTSALSEPGLFTLSTDDHANTYHMIGRERRSSGTQTPTNQRVAIIRSVSMSPFEMKSRDHSILNASRQSTCRHCSNIFGVTYDDDPLEYSTRNERIFSIRLIIYPTSPICDTHTYKYGNSGKRLDEGGILGADLVEYKQTQISSYATKAKDHWFTAVLYVTLS